MILDALPDYLILVLVGILVLTVSCILVSKPWQFVAPVPTRYLYLLLIIVLVGTFFRFEQPLEHYIFFDEDHYLVGAKDLASMDLHVSDAVYKKTGFELLIALVFFVSGHSTELVAFCFNIALGILTIPLIFLITRVLWSERAALLAAGFLAILPEHIRWSVTTSLEVSAIFFAILSLLFFLIFLKSQNWIHFALAIFVSIYLSFIRTEMIVIPYFMIIYLLFHHKLLFLGWKNVQNVFLSIVALFLVTWSGVITLLSRSNWNEMWTGGHNIETFFSARYFLSNISNILNYNFQILNISFFVLIVAFIFGAYQVARNKHWQKPAILLLVISLFLFGYYNSFFAGGYNVGNTVHSRFAAIWLSLFVVISGIGFESTIESFNKRHALRIGLSILTILSIYLQFNLQEFFPRTNQLWAVKQTEATLAFAKDNPQCLYLSTHPEALNFHGFETLTLDELNQKATTLDDASQCVIFLELEGCKYENKAMCDIVLRKYPWQKLSFEPVNLWQYSRTENKYVATIRPFMSQTPKTVFSVIKSKIYLVKE